MLYMFCTMLEDEGELINDIFELKKWQFYQKLLDWTCATSKFIKNDDFNLLRRVFTIKELAEIKRKLNRNIALSMYNKGSFHITDTDIIKRKLMPDCHFNKLEINEIGRKEHLLTNTFIVLNYMRPSKEQDNHGHIVFEFVHKSFYEFLAAEAVIEALHSLSINDMSMDAIAEVFYESFGRLNISWEIRTFIENLMDEILPVKLAIIYEDLLDFYYSFHLPRVFINTHSSKVIGEYFNKYPENISKKLEMESNVTSALLFLLPQLAQLCRKRFKIGKEKYDFKNFSLHSSTINNNDFLDLSFSEFNKISLQGMNLGTTDFSECYIDSCDLDYTQFVNSEFDDCQILNSNMKSVNLRGASFSNAVLKQLTIKESDFSDAIFENAILEKVKIEESNMHNLTFGNFSRLEGIKIYKSDLSHVIFENCYILDSMLKKIVIAYGSFENIKIENCDLTDSDFSYSTMTGLLQQSVCINSQFIKCNFKGGDCSNSDFTNANFSGANLEGVNFSNANLSNVNFKGANLKGAIFTNANLSKVDFSNIYLDDTYSLECDFTNALLADTNFTTLDLTKSKMKGTKLIRANLSFANLSKMDLSNINLKYAKVVNSNLSESILVFSEIVEAKICNACLRNCDLTGVDFLDSIIQDSDFSFSDLTLTNIEGRLSVYVNNKDINVKRS
ncbi:pentapeptide repeat-containing protein [Bacillus mycoides]|uniref:Pentapeptide repeat-containing protein n=1 Tax=Bacillus mycoides TaxID=1405 RepID=A0ABC9R7T3_BACMY|nr:pentapeptide repeat-containing protein [Bacillus mycoides]EJR43649.1 hypothetical protein III_01724 [Bacillus mycoides]